MLGEPREIVSVDLHFQCATVHKDLQEKISAIGEESGHWREDFPLGGGSGQAASRQLISRDVISASADSDHFLTITLEAPG